MMTVRNRVNMRAVYFILSLLLISCSKDDASEAPGKFELQNISIGEKQDQSSFENVAPNASIVLTFTDAVDEATIQSNIILKLNDQAVAYGSLADPCALSALTLQSPALSVAALPAVPRLRPGQR